MQTPVSFAATLREFLENKCKNIKSKDVTPARRRNLAVN